MGPPEQCALPGTNAPWFDNHHPLSIITFSPSFASIAILSFSTQVSVCHTIWYNTKVYPLYTVNCSWVCCNYHVVSWNLPVRMRLMSFISLKKMRSSCSNLRPDGVVVITVTPQQEGLGISCLVWRTFLSACLLPSVWVSSGFLPQSSKTCILVLITSQSSSILFSSLYNIL